MTLRRLILCLMMLAGCSNTSDNGDANNVAANNVSTNNSTTGSNNSSSMSNNSTSSTNSTTTATNNSTTATNNSSTTATNNNSTTMTNNSTTATNNSTIVIAAADYDQTCLYNSGCSTVFEGDVCPCLGCPTTSVANAVADQYGRDLTELFAMCPPQGLMCPDVLCAAVLPVCSSGTCGARPPSNVAATAFDQQCQTAADCVAIFEGEVCQPCQCDNAAVASDEAAAVLAVRDGVDCGMIPPVLCAECTMLASACNNNVCELVALP